MKLLNKSIRSYLIYSTVILLISIPGFYFVIQYIVADDVDESLLKQKELIIPELENKINMNQFVLLEHMDPAIKLIPLPAFYPFDTLYTASFTAPSDKTSNEVIPYRVLETNVMIKGKPYTLQLKNSLIDKTNLIQSIVKIVISLLLLIIAGLYIITWRLSKNIWKPFYNTLGKLRRYEIEKDDPLVFDKTGIAEFSDLNNSITTLTRRNQQVYQSQKEFTENASHEMQTPLAVFQGKLELLMQTTPLTSEQAALINDLANTTQRMNRLNKSLLLLTRIENNQFPGKEQVSIREVIVKAIEQYKFQAEQKDISFNVHLENEIVVEVNRALIEVLMNNLISNAIRHNIKNGIINISSAAGKEIVIQNTGRDQSLDSTKIFQRFQKDSADNYSTGLGLEMAKKIAAIYYFTIQYRFTNGLHTFFLRF
jgi:signal transduction histidine kinase